MADVRPGDGDAERLRIYWTTGVGGQKIRWNTPGDGTRCIRELEKYMPGQAAGYCQRLHQRMTGFNMGQAPSDKA